ncbi:MAG: endonuclease/exonuclease/phosphatase family protein [Micropruina sp.]|nr:endonuclease/exonuclease/phosphatase family protein [Micropruina sp.]
MTPPSTATSTRRSVDAARSRPRGQGWLVVLGLLAAVPAVGATALRIMSPTGDRLAKLAAFIPYGLVFWLPAAVLLGAAAVRSSRHRTPGRFGTGLLGLAATAGLVLALVWHGPAFVADSRPVTTKSLTVVSLNIARLADMEALAEAARGADVVVLAEVERTWVWALPDSFRKEFPHLAPVDRVEGSVIFSRHPIGAVEALPSSSFQQWAAIVRTPQLGAVRVVAVHPCNPYCGGGLWRSEAERLRTWLDERDRSIPTVVAGDFNAVDDHHTMQALYADGFRSAAHLAGAGFVRTWPADRRFPPVIAIDHVLVDGALTATAFGTFEVPRTDHLGVRAVIAGTAG